MSADAAVADYEARGWKPVQCGCHYGLEHGGEVPRECLTCGGGGVLWLTPSGTRLAQYPGGPFAGVASGREREVGACWCQSLATETTVGGGDRG